MSNPVRRAGRATLAGGTQVVWSVADGRRGRRWRVVTTGNEAMAVALLLEVGVDGHASRLELATATGLLTLHPGPSGPLHGNAVTRAGVRHLTFAWSPDHELEIDGLPVAQAVAARRLAVSMAVGEGRTVPVVSVTMDLSVREGARHYVRVGDATWRIDGDGDKNRDGASISLTIDDRGLPEWTRESEDWPLERESSG
jgi:hypothetical protein